MGREAEGSASDLLHSSQTLAGDASQGYHLKLFIGPHVLARFRQIFTGLNVVEFLQTEFDTRTNGDIC